jgi:hypothetical protein
MKSNSIDEVLTILEDAFDTLVAPKSIKRVDTNKLHLAFKADAAGFKTLNDSVLALSQRFQPLLCDESDLEDVASIVGSSLRPGKASMLAVTVTNNDVAAAHSLDVGVYQYTSVSGEVFSMSLLSAYSLAALESKVYYFSSVDIGMFHVSNIAVASIVRYDGTTINNNLSFSCADNQAYLGYDAETINEFRTRVSSVNDRDDIISEIESAIKALPEIYECNIIFNATAAPQVYDGITLAVKEMLIVLTGNATENVAKAVASRCHYPTHIVNVLLVAYYFNALYIGGKYPVYYMNHGKTQYNANIAYTYDSSKIKRTVAEAGMTALLASLTGANTHVDTVTELDVYQKLDSSSLVSVNVLNVDLLVGGSPVSYVTIPKTKIPQLVTINYTATDTFGG